MARKIFRVIDLIAAIKFGPKIIEIGAILAIFRPFENFGNRPDGNLYAAQGHTICRTNYSYVTFRPRIVEIGVILAIFRPFEVSGRFSEKGADCDNPGVDCNNLGGGLQQPVDLHGFPAHSGRRIIGGRYYKLPYARPKGSVDDGKRSLRSLKLIPAL